jgi:hypothetical protein
MTDNILSFPASKTQEKALRELHEQGKQLHEYTVELNKLIDAWTQAYLKEGEIYIQNGGNDPELVTCILTLKKTQEVFGVFL